MSSMSPIIFGDSDYDIHLAAPTSKVSADLKGVIHGIPCQIECKRIEYKAHNYKVRSELWACLQDSIVTELERIGRSVFVDIAFFAEPTKNDITLVLQLFKELEEIPEKAISSKHRNRSIVHLVPIPPGRIQLDGEFGEYERLYFNGNMALESDESTPIYIVGIQDHVPFDWSKNVRKTLKSSIRQLDKDKCNLVCLEVADLSNSEAPDEFSQIEEGIRLFLERDTRRVSAVLLTISGIVPDGSTKYRSAGKAWLFRHPNPYVTLPDSFETPSFNHPKIWVKASIQRGS